MFIESAKTQVAQKTLRRLAARALRIAEKHRAVDPAIECLAESLGATAKAFMDAYDAAMLSRTSRASQNGAGRGAVVELRRLARNWVTTLGRRLPVALAIGPLDSAVPEDVISAAERLIALVKDPETGLSPQDVDRATASLTPAIEAAREESVRARESSAEMQQKLQTVRDTADALQSDLVGLRRVLRSILSQHHLDYQALRIATDEVDAAEEQPVPAPAPAPTSDPTAPADAPAGGATVPAAPATESSTGEVAA